MKHVVKRTCKILILLVVFLSACVTREGKNHSAQLKNDDKNDNNDAVIIVKDEDVYNVKLPEESIEIPVVWEISKDIIYGSVFDIGISGDQLYVFGSAFNAAQIPEIYAEYKAGGGESIHYYFKGELTPIYYRPKKTFISQYDVSGNEGKTLDMYYSQEKQFIKVFTWQNKLAFICDFPQAKENLDYYMPIPVKPATDSD